MNDKIKAKLKSGEYILTEKRYAKSEVWISFREIKDASSTDDDRVRVGPGSTFNIFGLGPNCPQAGSSKILKFRARADLCCKAVISW
jgi:hypothetical protein